MNVLLISQCDKRALVASRRILDHFAERRGDRTWQTPITQAGLDTLRRMLRKTARKNTAVACHWIRGRDHSELLWVVGDAGRFNSQGAIPTNTTKRDVLRKDHENDWHTGEDIKLLAQLAALLHDLGKASVAFQLRLKQQAITKSLYRHEWVSLRLFLAFVGEDTDEAWLRRLAEPRPEDDSSWISHGRFIRDGIDKAEFPPFRKLPPLAAAVAWLVVTHHRLPVLPVKDARTGMQEWLGKKSPTFSSSRLANIVKDVEHDWNEISQPADETNIEPYWRFEHQLPPLLPKWKRQAAKIANDLLALRAKAGKGGWLENPYVMHVSRLCLMLADHYYSGLSPSSTERVVGDGTTPLYANTHSDGSLKQPLDEHLLGVARIVGSICRSLPGFERHLPRLARHRGLRKRSGSERFRWQDKAADAASAMRKVSAEQGAFVINMASTGCGKTLANARIFYALTDPERGMRATFALGLRTLTLQTGRSYRDDLHLGEDELAIRVGSSASRTLFEYYEAQAEASGSASIQELIDEDSHVFYEGEYVDHPLLSKAMSDVRIRALLSAPMLVCTIDHLMPATEAQRAGRQIAPMLRLMSSDLVLDELDDFDLSDLPALTRLVHRAGLLGSRVLLSSATLPPALVNGMFLAYRAGRIHYLSNRGLQGSQTLSVPEIPCLWVDEFGVHRAGCSDVEQFTREHTQFVIHRVESLDRAIGKEGPRRCGELIPLRIEKKQEGEIRAAFAAEVLSAILRAHSAHHEICPQSGRKVSFGLVRMANIEPLFDVAQELFRLGAPENFRIHLCVYHARFPLILRSAIEHQLDSALNRRDPLAVFDRTDIRTAIDSSQEQDHLFVVLGSPVTEVGRDHDYDWAVVEPSSMRSLIQLAGRVQRHRDRRCASPNILIFDTNLRHFSGVPGPDRQPGAAFVRPGFEDERATVDAPFRLITHRLGDLLLENEFAIITARPRIQPRSQELWQPKCSLVDLEHARLTEQMLPKLRETVVPSRSRQAVRIGLDAACAWQFPHASLTWVLPQQQPFRADNLRETDLLFLPDEDGERLVIHRVHQEARRGKVAIYSTAESQVQRLTLLCGPRIAPWGRHELLVLVDEQAEAQELSLSTCAERFTAVNLPESTQGWRYHPVLGFSKKS